MRIYKLGRAWYPRSFSVAKGDLRVISAASIEAIKKGKKVIGIVGGFKSLFAGDKRATVTLIHEEFK